MSKLRYWSSSCGRLQLELSLAEAESGSHQGDCEADVRALLDMPHIGDQVAAWDAEELRAHLKEYGAWDAAELADDDMNRVRQLWLACCDVREERDENAD